MRLRIRTAAASAAAAAILLLAGTPPESACAQSGCPVATVNGYQPVRYTMRATFLQAGTNTLGSAGPSYIQINYGDPISKQNITANRPIPQMVLRGSAWRESGWRQFNCTGTDNCTGPTVLSDDCGYGLMQITSCMDTGTCGWDRYRVAGELAYNLGTGAVFLISKWNQTWWLGSNDHTMPEQWYYAVMAYNGVATSNDPNNLSYDPRRPPFGEGNWSSYLSPRNYTYQEMVYGSAGNPQIASAGTHWLWRPTRIAEVPRGIFGLDAGGTWRPPYRTTAPLVWMLPGIVSSGGGGPSIVAYNPTADTLALDVMLYNSDGTFRTRWLDPSASWPKGVVPYIRLAPGQFRILPVADALFGASFNGYARIYASEGIDIALQAAGAPAAAPALGDPPYQVFLPQVFKNYGCTERLLNGGFEQFLDGKPRYWVVASGDGNSLADSTWFESGHFGGYLGGYDDAVDSMYQVVALPNGSSALSFRYHFQTKEADGAPMNDLLYLRVRDASGNLLATLWTGSNWSAAGGWQTGQAVLSAFAGQTVRISFEATTNGSQPTSFFFDNLSLIGCGY